ncbi:LysR family transcriptional regulator [Enterococcus sp. AZ109]|uniref:LysR family transcriptional regulator n=1 Tax=Enterococcus sp. AZ109 TaxID=2774634 RepID=UPI003F213A41
MLSKNYHYVITVAETGSFSKAAKQLFIAQSSLSQYIKNLEEDLGVFLFDRRTKPITLTQAGEQFIKTAYEIRYLEEKMQKQLTQLQVVKMGSLKIGITRYWGSLLLPRILPEFQARYPEVELKIIEGRTIDVMERLAKKQVDIAFFTPPNHYTPDDKFTYDVIYREEIMLALQQKILPGKNQLPEKIHLDQLRKIPFILLRKGQKLRQIADVYFQASDLLPTILMETENITTAYKLASVGFGATLIPSRINELTNPVGPIQHVHFEKPIYWSLAAVYEKDLTTTDFFDYLLMLSKRNILSN